MNRCIEACLSCYRICLGTAMNLCLETGGKHVEPAHFRLMMACAEICRTSAHFMLINTPHHKHTCRECAEICSECADDSSLSAGWKSVWRCAGLARRAAGRWPRDRRDTNTPLKVGVEKSEPVGFGIDL